jgi:hypothetical protein
MDPLSITGTCIGLAATIGKTSYNVATFVRQVRDARSDMDLISRELVSLKTALEMLAEDTNKPGAVIPGSLETQVQSVVGNCSVVVTQLDEALKKYEGEKTRTKVKWTWKGKDEMEKYRITLAAHKGALDLAIDLTALYEAFCPSLQLQLIDHVLADRSQEISKRTPKSCAKTQLRSSRTHNKSSSKSRSCRRDYRKLRSMVALRVVDSYFKSTSTI